MNFFSIPPFSRAGIQTFSRHEQKQDLTALVAAQISKFVLHSEELNHVWGLLFAFKTNPCAQTLHLEFRTQQPTKRKTVQ